MKLLFALILIISLVSSCYSQSSSSSSSSSSSLSSSSEECPEHYSGPSCSIFQPYIWLYNAANPDGGWVTFYGDFGSDTTGLSVKIGTKVCSISWFNSGRIECAIDQLNQFEFYDVEVSNANGVLIFLEDFYSPYINDCGYGTFSMGRCQCYFGYQGQLCDTEMSPFISSITSSSIDGGLVTAQGWFGSNPQLAQEYKYFIGNKQLRIQYVQPNSLVGYAPEGTGTQDVTIYDSTNTLLLFTGSNLYSYDSNKCFNDCFNNGVCNSGVCTCYYPWVGDFCSQTKDSSCPCTSA